MLDLANNLPSFCSSLDNPSRVKFTSNEQFCLGEEMEISRQENIQAEA